MLKTPGVYIIRCAATGSRYVGSAINLSKRFSYHQWQLHAGRHHNQYLQRAWNKYGEENFAFEILLTCHKDDLLFYEQRALDILLPEFNVLPKAGNVLGLKWSEEAKARHSCTWREKVAPKLDSAARGKKISEAWNKGAYVQAMRERSNQYEYEGQLYTLAEASDKFGINANTLKYRISKGMSFMEAVSTPLVSGGRFAKWGFDGRLCTMDEVAAACGVKTATIRKRLSKGWTFAQATNQEPRS